MKIHLAHTRRRANIIFLAALLVAASAVAASAHPLGNFTINHFSRVEIGERVSIHYVVDMAEIPAFQESQRADANGDGATTDEELNAYLSSVTPQLAGGLLLTIDGARIPLELAGQRISRPAGVGGLQTLRIECDFAGELPPNAAAGQERRLRFEDSNHRERTGWREIVATSTSGVAVFNSSAYANGATDEIRAYPEDKLSAPLDERTAELSFVEGSAPAGATALLNRDGRPAAHTRDRFAELIEVKELTLWVALAGLLVALALGALHALSPGHGKTVVGAYLVGTRGTAKHAAFLGLTVTLTHTSSVFALGVVTLFAAQYVVPERLFPILSLVSGAVVLFIGLSLFVKRLRAALGGSPHGHTHEEHASQHAHEHDNHAHGHDGETLAHSHGGSTHTHLPPGTDGGRVTWRSLLALGISGGLLPCPSALVVLLAAIAAHRVGYGLLLIVAFSTGLAATLTGIGLAFVYAGRLMKRRVNASGRLVRVMPALSAFVIACVGGAICYEAIIQAGFSLTSLLSRAGLNSSLTPTASVLALGFVFGLKHAVEADHLAAVSTIVSERKSLLSSSLVGGLWGVGHTISLLVAGVAVILLRVEIGKRLEMALEFCVALMLVALGANAARKLWRGGTIHLHTHRHGARAHVHPHLHDAAPENEPHTHHGFRIGKRPLFVGMLHGLAGSAALMLLVLAAIPSPLVGLAYIVVFGLGSIGGMMGMSMLMGLPFRFMSGRFARVDWTLRGAAAVFSLCFGLFMVYEIGFVDGLFY
ncbi:MAG: hypothetical protein LC754_03495 [Acidobacteria bacterium]|nr:hypothetical protein [Acidobacteriota bacterium]